MKSFLIMFFIFITIYFIPISPEANGNFLKRPFSFQHITPKNGLSSEMVYAIAVQGEEIWFGTYGGGATRYDIKKGSFRAYTTKGEPMEEKDDGDSLRWKNLLSYNHVSTILCDVDRIWFGTYFYGYGGGGISYYNPQKTPPWKTFNTNNGRAKKVVSMALDGENLWVGSEKGLSLLNKKKEEWLRFYSMKEISGNFVNTILVKPEWLWVGTNGGISRLNKKRMDWKNYSLKEGLTETEIKSLVMVGEKIWAGGSDGSLFEYDGSVERWKRIDSRDPLKSGGINSIVVFKDKVFICRDNGVSVFESKTGRWDSITTSDGLLSNNVFCAAVDRDGIWFGTDKGASRLNILH